MVLTEGQKQAIEKLDAEMEKAKDPCSKYIAEQLLQLASSCPDVAEKSSEKRKLWQVRWVPSRQRLRSMLLAAVVAWMRRRRLRLLAGITISTIQSLQQGQRPRTKRLAKRLKRRWILALALLP